MPNKRGFTKPIWDEENVVQAASITSDPIYVGDMERLTLLLKAIDPNDAKAPGQITFTVQIAFTGSTTPVAADWAAYEKLITVTGVDAPDASVVIAAPVHPTPKTAICSLSAEDNVDWLRVIATAAGGVAGDNTDITVLACGHAGR